MQGHDMTHGTGRNVNLTIDEGRCRVCARCLAKSACRGGAIRVIDRDEAPVIDMARCRGCLVCVPACPTGAVVKWDDAR